MKQPPIGLTTNAEIVRWKDGDTVVVSFTKQVTVRLNECWAPETHKTEFDKEKELGLKLKALVEEMYPSGTKIVLHVGGDNDALDEHEITLGRVVGTIFQDGKDANEEIVRTGLAFNTKEELHEYLKKQCGE
jgi:endonuclease YncB( thermonuclease family)